MFVRGICRLRPHPPPPPKWHAGLRILVLICFFWLTVLLTRAHPQSLCRQRTTIANPNGWRTSSVGLSEASVTYWKSQLVLGQPIYGASHPRLPRPRRLVTMRPPSPKPRAQPPPNPCAQPRPPNPQMANREVQYSNQKASEVNPESVREHTRTRVHKTEPCHPRSGQGGGGQAKRARQCLEKRSGGWGQFASLPRGRALTEKS